MLWIEVYLNEISYLDTIWNWRINWATKCKLRNNSIQHETKELMWSVKATKCKLSNNSIQHETKELMWLVWFHFLRIARRKMDQKRAVEMKWRRKIPWIQHIFCNEKKKMLSSEVSTPFKKLKNPLILNLTFV